MCLVILDSCKMNDMTHPLIIVCLDVSAHLQGHCHWVVDLAIKLVAILAAAAAKDESKPVVSHAKCIYIQMYNVLIAY